MSKIKFIKAREIIDSRGNPTIEVDVILDNGILGRASVPSGTSTGSKEAFELRDNDKKRFQGLGVLKAVKNVQKVIGPELLGHDPEDQFAIDALLINLDGTDNKHKLGANALLAVSIAVVKAAAKNRGLPVFRYLGGEMAHHLPTPFFNIINGGKHADNYLDIQEFLIVPVGAESFHEAYRMGCETYHALKLLLKSKELSTSVGDEGGFAPRLSSNQDALELMIQAIEKAGYTPGKDIFLALDAAANEFYHNGKYSLKADQTILTAKEMVTYYANLCSKYPIVSIEDGLAETDWEGWKTLTQELGKSVQLTGDDIFVTNTKYLAEGIKQGVANSVLIKPNQIGTVSETLKTIELAKSAAYSCLFSHRSGETEDAFLADLAVATHADQLKSGAPARSERLAKYNKLLRIEEYLGPQATFKGALRT
jgi:enolase